MTAVGLDLGGSFLKVVVVDGDEELERSSVPVSGSPLDLVMRTVAEVTARHPGSSVGLAVAGLVRDGTLVWAPHVDGVDVRFRPRLEEMVEHPVAVDNDANLAALAEGRLGAGRGTDPLLVVTLGTGIGAGLVVGGRVHRGRAFGGEVGHLTVRPDGDPCACGRNGCWETLVSGPVLDRIARELAVPVDGAGEPEARHLVEAARVGNPAALAAVADVGGHLGRGLVGLVLTLDPERIVIAGAVSLAGEPLLGPARAALAADLPGGSYRGVPDLVAGRFGRWAGAMGAALAGVLVQNGDHDW